MEIENRAIDTISPYHNNPRKNEDAIDGVKRSISDFGWQQPIVVDPDGVIIVGHTRYYAAKDLGMTEVPVTVMESSPDKIKMYRLADNKVGEAAQWDTDKLDQELSELINDFNFDVEDYNFEVPEPDAEVEEDTDFDPDSVAPKKTARGDIWELGNHRLMVGDSTSFEDVSKLMDGEQADLLITDPPYNVDYSGGKNKVREKIENDSMSDAAFKDFLIAAFSNAEEVLKPGASFYIWYANMENVNFTTAARETGLNPREILIWAKNNFSLGRSDYNWKHEPCLYGWKDGAAHNWYSDRSQSTVLEFPKPVNSKLHPTMKPVALFDYQVQNSTKPGDLVLDLFGGSGTTIIVCEQNGRRANVMEYDPKYADVIINRWEELTGETATKL